MGYVDLDNSLQWSCLEAIGAGAEPQAWKGFAKAKFTIELRCCFTFGMDVHARKTVAKGIDRSTGATVAKRFDDVPVPSEIASWMQSEFTGPSWYAAYEPVVLLACWRGEGRRWCVKGAI